MEHTSSANVSSDESTPRLFISHTTSVRREKSTRGILITGTQCFSEGQTQHRRKCNIRAGAAANGVGRRAKVHRRWSLSQQTRYRAPRGRWAADEGAMVPWAARSDAVH